MAKRGMLVFKGDDPKKKKKKLKHSKKSDERAAGKDDDDDAAASTHVARLPPVPQKPQSTAAAAAVPKIMACTGEITTSGTVVTGHETKFEREIMAGDALIVSVPGGQPQEMRVITMRLSNISLNLSSAFSQDIKTPTAFSIIKKPRDEAKLKLKAERMDAMTKKEQEERASGTFGSTEELVYREKTEHGSYRIRRVKVETAVPSAAAGGVSRQDLLDLRSKKTSDKYC